MFVLYLMFLLYNIGHLTLDRKTAFKVSLISVAH